MVGHDNNSVLILKFTPIKKDNNSVLCLVV
jgi:hypothetical protein